MKKLLVVGTIILSLALTGCNAGSRHFGGTINILNDNSSFKIHKYKNLKYLRIV